MGICSVCENETNYRCITCQTFICNRSNNCNVPVEEGNMTGWQMGQQVALCHSCYDSGENTTSGSRSGPPLSENSTSDHVSQGMQQFQINCGSRGFHIYRDVWNPVRGEILEVNHDYGNVHDPFALSLNAASRGRRLAIFDIVGHIPREISRFCHYFLSYGGSLEARVRDSHYRRSPIPKGGWKYQFTSS